MSHSFVIVLVLVRSSGDARESLAFSIHPSSILADLLDAQPSTKDDDEEEYDDENEALNRKGLGDLLGRLFGRSASRNR